MTIILSQCGDDSTKTIRYISNNPPCNRADHNGNPCEACTELLEIEAQMEELHSKLKDLHRKHVSISASKRKLFHECGIDKLPNEIMRDIILRVCLPAVHPLCDRHQYRVFSGSRPLHPLNLAKVCRRWQDLAFSIPKLWSAFALPVCKPNMALINFHLRLSGPTSPLSLKLFARYDETIKEDAAFKAMAFINENIHRIAYLCIDVPEYFYEALSRGSRTFADAAPMLEELHIHQNGLPSQSCSIDFKLCTNPPSPQRVYIVDYHPFSIHLDWLNVSTLNLRCSKLPSLDIVNVLSNAKSLVKFDCGSTLLNQIPGLPNGLPIVYDSIRKVKIYFSNSCQVLLKTTMCSLESLAITYLGSLGLELLPPFLQRSASQLTSLELSFHDQQTGEDLINIFQYTEVLQALKIHFGCSPYIADASPLPFLNRLSMPVSQVFDPAGDPILLPHLKKLHLSGKLLIRYSPYLKIMENRHATIALSGGGRVRALDELVIRTKTNPERPTALTKHELRLILDLRGAQKIVSISWQDEWKPNKKIDLVEEAIASYKT